MTSLASRAFAWADRVTQILVTTALRQLYRVLRPAKRALLLPVSRCTERGPVFITGCDTGFGRALALSLDARGVPVVAACLTAEGCASLQKEGSERLRCLTCDVTKAESVKQAAKAVAAVAPNGVWAVVNNAGIFGEFNFELTPMELFQRTMDVNYMGTVRVIKEFLPLLKKAKGRVINVSSLGGVIAYPPLTAYSSSKFAVEALSDVLRLELRHYGIKVCVVQPFFTRTPMVEECNRAMLRLYEAAPEEIRKEFPEDWPARARARFALLEEVADDPCVVLDDLEHAVLSRCPATRYRCGYTAKLVALFAWYAPTWVRDCWGLGQHL